MRTTIIVTAAVAVAVVIAGPAAAQDSVAHASRASEHASAAVGDLTAAGVLAVGGVVAAPLALAGGASAVGGAASAATGGVLSDGGLALADAAEELVEASFGKPLKVGAAVVVAQPVPRLAAAPAQAVRR